jgi:hypothetical protein
MSDTRRTRISADFLKTPRTALRRKPGRGSHDWETIADILDEGIFCHIGFVADGQPYVVPTGYGRDDHTLYIHGSSASRMLRTLSGGIPVCVTVSLIDGLVLARSAFHHSINYRSVMVLGNAELVEGDEKLHGLATITNHMAHGRWDDVRPPTEQEMKATSVLRLPIEEASAKLRVGGVIDEPDDMNFSVWAGVQPLSLVAGEPQPDEQMPPGIELPAYLRPYRR